MSVAIRYEAHLAAASVMTGVGLMIVYDLVCILRMLCPHSSLAVNIEDFGYGIYCAVITFGLLYEQNNGTLRAYVIAGTILGMIAYQRLVGSILLKYLKKGQEYLRIKIKLRQRRKRRCQNERSTENQKKKAGAGGEPDDAGGNYPGGH